MNKPNTSLKRMAQDLAQTLRGRQRAFRELSTLNEISRAIIRAELDVDALCELVYHEASKVLDTSWFHLALFEGRHYILKVRIQEGRRLPPEQFDLGDDEGLIGWMRRTGRALLVEDFQRELPHLPARPRYQAAYPPRSGLYVPLLAGDTVIGTISVQSPQPRAFDQDDFRFLSLIADAAAAAIAKARAYAQLRERLGQLELISEVGRRTTAILDLDQLLPSVVTLIRDQFQYYHVHLFTFDPAKGELIFRASTAAGSSFWVKRFRRLKIGQGIVGSVAATRTAVMVNDVAHDPRYIRDIEGTQSEIAVPLSIGDDLLAVLDVQADRPNAFDESDRSVLQAVADSIGCCPGCGQYLCRAAGRSWTLAALLQTAENVAHATSLEICWPRLCACHRCWSAVIAARCCAMPVTTMCSSLSPSGVGRAAPATRCSTR